MSTGNRPAGVIDLAGLTREEFIVLTQETIARLRWHYGTVHPMRVEARTRWSAWSYGEDIRIDIGETQASVSSRQERWSIGAKKRNARNVQRFVDTFAEVRASFPAERMRNELTERAQSGVMEQTPAALEEEPTSWKDGFMLLVPRKDFFATPLLIDASLLVYILMTATGVNFIAPSSEDLLTWGANFRPYTMNGEWWRLLTCCFEHIGIIHLLFNMYALLMVGIYLEPLLGRWRLLMAYVITGVFASVASLWWHDNTVSAGASGAIFGLYGVFLALLLTDLIPKETRKSLLSSIGIFVVYNLVNGVRGNIDNAAHIGGLVSGLVLGASLYFALRNPERTGLTWPSILAPVVLCGAVGSVAVRSLPQDDGLFHEKLKTFSVLEERGLLAYNMHENATGSEQLVLVNDSCLPAWEEAVDLLEGTKGLELSAGLTEQRDLYMAYADARRRNMQLLKRSLEQGDTAVGPELERSFAEVDSVLTLINGED